MNAEKIAEYRVALDRLKSSPRTVFVNSSPFGNSSLTPEEFDRLEKSLLEIITLLGSVNARIGDIMKDQWSCPVAIEHIMRLNRFLSDAILSGGESILAINGKEK